MDNLFCQNLGRRAEEKPVKGKYASIKGTLCSTCSYCMWSTVGETTQCEHNLRPSLKALRGQDIYCVRVVKKDSYQLA